MLLLLVSVASWTTELARLDAIEALDAEIDAAEKAVDGAALIPRPLDVAADVQLERDTRATLEDAETLLKSLNTCQEKSFGARKMTEDCKEAIQKAIESAVTVAKAQSRWEKDSMAEIVEEARSKALNEEECSTYEKPWWPPNKEDPSQCFGKQPLGFAVGDGAQGYPDRLNAAEIFTRKGIRVAGTEKGTATGTTRTLELVQTRARLTSDHQVEGAVKFELNLDKVSSVHSCAHRAEALSPTYSADGTPEEYEDAPTKGKLSRMPGLFKWGAKQKVKAMEGPKSICDQDQDKKDRTAFLSNYYPPDDFDGRPDELAKRELAVVIKMKKDYIPELADHDRESVGPQHVLKDMCPYIWREKEGVCYYLTCDALLGTFCSKGTEKNCNHRARDDISPISPTTWGWLSKRDVEWAHAIPDEKKANLEWVNKNFEENGCDGRSGNNCRSVCRSAMESFVDSMNAFLHVRNAGGGGESTGEGGNDAQTYANVIGYMLEGAGSATLNALPNAIGENGEGGTYLDNGEIVKKKGADALAEDRATVNIGSNPVNSGSASADTYAKLAMQGLACAGGVAIGASGVAAIAAAPLAKPCLSVLSGALKWGVAKVTKKRDTLKKEVQTFDAKTEELAKRLAWVEQYSESVSTLLKEQHGDTADPSADTKLQFMWANSQTLACAVETVGTYVEVPRLSPTNPNKAKYEDKMKEADAAFSRIVDQVKLALDINGQANVQKMVEKAKTEIVAKLETTKTEIMGKIDEGRPESDLDF
jgi:hypothetical protein